MIKVFSLEAFEEILPEKRLKVLVILVLTGIYLGIILFGENSIVALYKIHKEKNDLTVEIEKLKESNQKLQYDHFLLKQLEPKSSD